MSDFLSLVRTASVQVVSKTAVCLIIQKKDVNRLIGNIEGKPATKGPMFESSQCHIFRSLNQVDLDQYYW